MPALLFDLLTQQVEKAITVLIIEENLLPRVA
jgi:hypothetical protein